MIDEKTNKYSEIDVAHVEFYSGFPNIEESKKIFKSRQDEQWQQLDHDEVDAYKITKLQPLLYKSTKQNKKDKLSNEESLMN